MKNNVENDKEKSVQAHEYSMATHNHGYKLRSLLMSTIAFAFNEDTKWNIYLESITSECFDKGKEHIILDASKQRELFTKINKKRGDVFSFKEKKEWIKQMDLQAMLKSLVYGSNHKACMNTYIKANKINTQPGDFREIIFALMRWRNKKSAHTGSGYFEDFTPELFENQITKPVDDFVKKLKNCPNEEVQELYKEWEEQKENTRKRLGYPPIEIEELAKERGEESKKLKDKLVKRGFSVEKGFITGVSKKIILEYLKMPKGDADIQTTNTSKTLQPLRFLNKLKTAGLKREHLMEVIEKYAIVIDSTALLSEEFLKYIRINIEPYMQQTKKVFLVDRATRRDLREKEKRYYQVQEMITELRHLALNGIISDEDSLYLEGLSTCENSNKQAKTALIYLDELARKGLVTYYDADDVMGDEEENIFEVVEKYNTKRICVLSLNNFLVSRLIESKNENVIAIRSVAGTGFVWKAFLSRLNPDLEPSDQDKLGNVTVQTEKQKVVQKEEQLEIKGDKLKQIVKGNQLFDSKGQAYKLCNKIGEGGEGGVYTVEEKDIVAKVYFDTRLTKQRYEKLKKMVEKRITIEGVCWPMEILYDKDNNFRGYLMPKVVTGCMELGLSVLKLSSRSVREKIMPGWDRKSLVKLSVTICQLFVSLHDNDILMGDVNPRNIMINPQNPEQVWFVDCDSYQFGNYKCPVGTNIFTSPRIYKKYGKEPEYNRFFRTKEDEQYAIASLLFQVLMVGQSPFASKRQDNNDMVDAICNHVFGYSRSTNEEVAEGPYKMIWNNMNYNMKKRFISVFAEDNAISETEWIKELKYYLRLLEEGKSVNEIFPTKYKSIEEGQFVDFTCEICKKRTNMDAERYKKKKEKQQSIYCNECQAFVNRLKNRKKIIPCKGCYNDIHTTEFMDFMTYQNSEFIIKCPNCGYKNRRK